MESTDVGSISSKPFILLAWFLNSTEEKKFALLCQFLSFQAIVKFHSETIYFLVVTKYPLTFCSSIRQIRSFHFNLLLTRRSNLHEKPPWKRNNHLLLHMPLSHVSVFMTSNYWPMPYCVLIRAVWFIALRACAICGLQRWPLIRGWHGNAGRGKANHPGSSGHSSVSIGYMAPRCVSAANAAISGQPWHFWGSLGISGTESDFAPESVASRHLLSVDLVM